MKTPHLALCALSTLLLSSPALAQRGPSRAAAARAAAAKKAAEAKKKKAEEKPEPPPRWFAVHAGQVHTVTQGVLRDVTILSRNGRIHAIGRDLSLPKGTEVLDAKGKRVYPGLIAYNSFGIVASNPEHGTDVFGLNLVIALSQGITTVGAGNSIAKLTYGTLEGHLLGPRPTLLRLRLNGAANKARLRADLDKVREYQRDLREHQLALKRGEKDHAAPKKLSGKLGAYLGMLQGSVWATVKADRRQDLNEVATFAETYGFRVLIEGGAEAWTMAPRLARVGCRVVVNPRGRDSAREDTSSQRPSGWTIENAKILHQHGIPLTIVTQSGGIGLWGLAGNDLFTLSLEAGFAIRGGLPQTAALEALTLQPARFMGVDDRLGSIEVGKDMDLVVLKGDLFRYTNLPEWTIVNGRIAYDKAKDTLLKHVRPRDLKQPEPPVILWPRRKDSAQPEKQD